MDGMSYGRYNTLVEQAKQRGNIVDLVMVPTMQLRIKNEILEQRWESTNVPGVHEWRKVPREWE